MKATLKAPYGDKNYHIEFIGVNDSERQKIRSLMNMQYKVDEDWKSAKPFLQGDSGDWMMIEFWVKGKFTILIAIEHLEKTINIQVENSIIKI
jgi:hypothetical protein